MKLEATTLYPFVPSGPDYLQALAFFSELGFERLWEQNGYAGLRFGGAFFILQKIHVPEWQSNQMIVFEVTNLDDYWTQLQAKNLETKFVGVKLKAPAEILWGRELTVIDPGGVCWHVRQRDRYGVSLE